MAEQFAAEPMPRIDPGRPGFAEAWDACAAILEEIQARKKTELRLAELRGKAAPGTLSGTAMGSRLAESALAFITALAGGEADRQDACAAAAGLVGLGPGLTPSGDDFLCGLLAALRCGDAERGGLGRFLAAFRVRLPELRSRTTAVGAAYLDNAAAGAVAPAILRLARVLSNAGAKAGENSDAPRFGDFRAAARAALDDLCAIGHSSGADTATGLLIGLGVGMEWARRAYAP